MTCDSIREKLNALIDRELSILDWVRVRLHLIRCRECRKRLDQYRRITFTAGTIRTIPIPPRARLVPAFALAIVVVAMFALNTSPKARMPQALVFDQTSLVGNLKPTSAFYAEGDHLILRDPKSGKVLASAPGRTRKDAFNAISIANRVPIGDPKEFRVTITSGGDRADVILLEGAEMVRKDDEPNVVFFVGDVVDIKKAMPLPASGPTFFVKIIDPEFFIELESDMPKEKFILEPNKKPTSGNR